MLLWLLLREIYRLFKCTLPKPPDSRVLWLPLHVWRVSSSTACYLSTLPRVPKRLYLLPARVPFLRYQINIFVDVIYSVWTSPHLSWASAVSTGCWCKLICNPTLGAVTGCWISRAGNTDSSYFYPLVKCATVCQLIKVRINCLSIENIKNIKNI